MKTDRLRWRHVVMVLFYLAVGVFLWRYIASLDFDELRSTTVSWALLAAALPIGMLARLLMVLGWKQILSHYDSNVPRLTVLNAIYGTAWLGRYIPGTVWYHVGKVTMIHGYGVSKEDASLSSALEVILQVATGFAVGLLLIAASGQVGLLDDRSVAFGLMFLLTATVLLTPRVFNRIVSFLIRRFQSQDFDERHFVDGGLLSRLTATYFSVHLLTGIPAFLILKSVYPEAALSDLPYLTGAVVLSGAMGVLAIFVPSGLGVREGLQLVLLSAVFPAEAILVFVILMRLWSIFVDFSYWGASRLILARVGRTASVTG